MDDMEADIARLVEEGIFTLNDEMDGYSVDWDLFRTLHPSEAEEFWQLHLADIDESLDVLMDAGLIEATLDENESGEMDWIYRVTDKGREYLQEMGGME